MINSEENNIKQRIEIVRNINFINNCLHDHYELIMAKKILINELVVE